MVTDVKINGKDKFFLVKAWKKAIVGNILDDIMLYIVLVLNLNLLKQLWKWKKWKIHILFKDAVCNMWKDCIYFVHTLSVFMLGHFSVLVVWYLIYHSNIETKKWEEWVCVFGQIWRYYVKLCVIKISLVHYMVNIWCNYQVKPDILKVNV